MRFARFQWMKWICDDRGQVLVMTVFSMAMLLGMLGLAVDVGVLFHARRQMQTAADAAAMAGATEMFYNGATGVDAKAKDAAKANGVDSTVAGNTVIVTTSPTLAGGVACATCVKVQVATPNPTIFMQTMSQLVFRKSNYKNVNVSAAAVGGAPGSSKTCMYVMDPDSPSSLWIHGAGKINAPGCSVYVNSKDPGALCVTGSAGKSDISNIAVFGEQGGKGNCKGDPGAPVYTDVKAQTPAIAAQGIPDHPEDNCKSGNTFDLSASGGKLSGDLRSSAQTPGYGNYACFKNQTCTTKGKTTTCTSAPVDLGGGTTTLLGAGIYVFETGVNVSGNTTVGIGNNSKSNPQTAQDGGATIVVTGTGAFDSSTASNFSIWAPADKTSVYNAVAIYQPSSDTQAMTLQFGSSSSYFVGAVYAPSAAVDLHDQGGAVTATDLIVGDMYVNGTINLSNYSTFNPITTPFLQITLVE
jgi:Flp pilus assembly protein TadG